MNYGINPDQYEILNRIVIEPLKSHGASVYIFGSRATGKHHSHSDVDILYRTKSPLPPGFISDLKEKMEESRFPFTLDLVNEMDLADSYWDSVEQQLIEL